MVLINASFCHFEYSRLRATQTTDYTGLKTKSRQYKTCIQMMPPVSAPTVGGKCGPFSAVGWGGSSGRSDPPPPATGLIVCKFMCQNYRITNVDRSSTCVLLPVQFLDSTVDCKQQTTVDCKLEEN